MDERKWNLRRVDPIGKAKVFGHAITAGHCAWGEFEIDDYPEDARREGDRFREARVALRLGLRAASGRLGITVVELCAVERGAMKGDVDAMIDELRRGVDA